MCNKELIDVKNKGNECFHYNYLLYVHKVEIVRNPHLVSKYKEYKEKMKCGAVNFPVFII